jgi:hypothetical protein
MKEKTIIYSGYISCLTGFALSACFSFINIIEIIHRASGAYTFYSQRASLSDGEAVIYFSCSTLAFLFMSYVAVKYLIKKNYTDAILSSLLLLLLILSSTYADKFFYHSLP